MTSDTATVAVMELLKPRDLASLPPRRGRRASQLYPTLIQAFLAAGEPAMDVDCERIGRKAETVRTALVRAVKRLGVEDKVRVAKVGSEVVLIYRMHSPAHGFPISPYGDEVREEVAAR